MRQLGNRCVGGGRGTGQIDFSGPGHDDRSMYRKRMYEYI